MNIKLKQFYIIFIGVGLITVNNVRSENINLEPREAHSSKDCSHHLHYHGSHCDDKKMELLFNGAFLYWKGELRGIESAFAEASLQTHNDEEDKIVIKTNTESDKSPSFKWHSGVRLGTSFLVKGFNFDFNWTYFPGRAFYKLDDKHFGNWTLKYNDFDLKIGHKFYPTSHFYVKPFIGIRGTTIRQTLHSYFETPKIDDDENLRNTTDINNKENFNWVGPQIGVECDWYMGWNFSLYCMIDVVNYYGHNHSDYLKFDTTSNDPDGPRSSEQTEIWKKKAHFNNFALDDSFGIRWDKYILYSKCNVHFNLKLGYEQHRIYEFSNLMGEAGSLSMDGAILEAGLGILF